MCVRVCMCMGMYVCMYTCSMYVMYDPAICMFMCMYCMYLCICINVSIYVCEPSTTTQCVNPGPLVTPDPFLLGRYDERLVLLRHQAAGAVGRPQQVDDQRVGQHVQLLHIIPRHVHRTRQTLPDTTANQRADQSVTPFCQPLAEAAYIRDLSHLAHIVNILY